MASSPVSKLLRAPTDGFALSGVDAAGEPWRMTRAEVADAIARGAESFVAGGPDGESPRVLLAGEGGDARLVTSTGEPLDGEA